MLLLAAVNKKGKRMRAIVLGLIAIYQRVISPAIGSRCRFRPTCSEYMRQAVIKYGAVKGTWLGLKRLVRCHPFNPGGYDPVR